jgi:hypothetical protein
MMSLSSQPPVEPDAVRGSDLIEQLSHRFLESWQLGQPEQIEKLLMQVSTADQERLLRGLLIIELGRRRNAGHDPQPEEYARRFPHHAALVKQVFEMAPPARKKKSRPSGEAPQPAPPRLPAVENPTSKQQALRSTQKIASPASAKPASVPAGKSPAGKSLGAGPAKAPNREKSSRAGRPSAPAADVPAEDEFAALVAADSEKKYGAPAPVVRKKKKEKPVEKPQKKRSQGESQPATEFLIPLVLAVVSLAIYVVVAFVTVPQGAPVGLYLGFKLGFTLILTVITILALFVAAALLDTTYGFFDTAIVKSLAIVLTQAWMSEISALIPIPYLGSLVTWVATFYMFVAFFDLDHLEAIRSMFIVRGVYTLAFMLLFAGMISLVISGKGGAVGDALAGLGGVADAEADEEFGDVPGGKAAAGLYRTVTKQFGDALVAQDYPRAYALMSAGYQATVSADEFAAIQRKAVADFGKPLKCEAGVGTLDRADLAGPGFARFASVPVEIRCAWMHAELALELDDGETMRCVDCWLLLVEGQDGFRVGAFEYQLCD